MAIFYLRYKYGKNATAHLDYISRDGKYSKKEDLVFSETKNLPREFENIKDFWNTSITNERKNSIIYREFEISLPKEYDDDKNKKILKNFLEDTFRNKYIYNYSMHNPKGEQPHAHIMFCERELDGIKRDKNQFFKRYNSKNPKLGGAKKNRMFQSKDFIKKIRKDWANHLNLYLKVDGIKLVTEKSLEELKEEAIKNNDKLNEIINDRVPINYNRLNKKEKKEKEIKEIKELLDKVDEYNEEKYKEEMYEKYKKTSQKSDIKDLYQQKEEIEEDILKNMKKMKLNTIKNELYDKYSKGEYKKLKKKLNDTFKKIKLLSKEKDEKSIEEMKKLINERKEINKKIYSIERKYKKNVDKNDLKIRGKIKEKIEKDLEKLYIINKSLFKKLKDKKIKTYEEKVMFSILKNENIDEKIKGIKEELKKCTKEKNDKKIVENNKKLSTLNSFSTPSKRHNEISKNFIGRPIFGKLDFYIENLENVIDIRR